MKKVLLILLLLVVSCISFSRTYCVNVRAYVTGIITENDITEAIQKEESKGATLILISGADNDIVHLIFRDNKPY